MGSSTHTSVGVLGGGQLGRMLAIEARRMGARVLQWTGGDRSGAADLADVVMTEAFDDREARRRFLDEVSVATVEFENVPFELLDALARDLPVMPAAHCVRICQHREREKRFLQEHDFPCVRFAVVESAATLAQAVRAMPGDSIVKTAEFGYDGKGQRPAAKEASDAEIASIWTSLACTRAVVEEKIDLASEISVLVVRDARGASASYDAAENQHRHHILDVSIVPARVADEIQSQARSLALRIADAMAYVGVLAVEFFVATDGRLLVNEMAPRPHNSGHHTLDACACSQFEQQFRIVSGRPLGSTELVRPAVLWNLLGDLWVDAKTPPDWSPILETPGAKLHLYGKDEARVGRKMGHVTFLGATREEALARASTCRKAFGLPEIR